MIDLIPVYRTISNELQILKFKGESDINFHSRLVYSALGSWILKLSKDRDSDENDTHQVSKTHVTYSALEILNAFLQMDSSLSNFYFAASKNDCDEHWKISLIKNIESNYIQAGYFDSGNYSFHETQYAQRYSFKNGYDLCIDNSSSVEKMISLGTYNKHDKITKFISEFFPSKASALDVFNLLSKSLIFQPFQREKYNNVKIYDISQYEWVPFQEEIALRYAYSFLRIDLEHRALLKNMNGNIQYSYLPDVYQPKVEYDRIYKDEDWKLLFGMAAYIGKPFSVNIIHQNHDAVLFNFGKKVDFTIPVKEKTLLHLMAWPVANCFSNSSFITYEEMTTAIKQILSRLSMQIIEK